MSSRVIALDIGNVCLQITPEKAAEYFGVNQLWSQNVPFWQMLEKFECGKLTEKDFVQKLRQMTSEKFTPAEISHGWNLVLGEEIPGMADFVSQMRERDFRFVFFSDTSSLHLREVRRKLSFAPLVPDGIYSFEVGARKPHQLMYEAFEKLYGVPHFYFDDRADNIAGAQQRGWPAVQFLDLNSAWEAVGKAR